ncbi:MAG: hypothetical protein ABW217_13740 [Polyangiaceae bacterium]
MSARGWATGVGLILATSGVARAELEADSGGPSQLQGATEGSAQPQRHRPWRKQRLAPAAPGTPAPAPPAEPEPLPLPESRQGFFARFAFGIGVFTAATGGADDRRSYVGLPLSFELYFGGTIAPMLSLGAGYLRDEILALSSSDAVLDGDEPELDDTSFCLEALSLLISVYPHPRSPFHGTLTAGFGRMYSRRPADPVRAPLFLPTVLPLSDTDPEGFVFSLGGGYDTWLDAEWAMSLSARVLLAPFAVNENGQDIGVTVFTPSLLVGLSHL